MWNDSSYGISVERVISTFQHKTVHKMNEQSNYVKTKWHFGNLVDTDMSCEAVSAEVGLSCTVWLRV